MRVYVTYPFGGGRGMGLFPVAGGAGGGGGGGADDAEEEEV